VAGVNFNVREGELFGFLGPNGAGKTMTINRLSGLARPDASGSPSSLPDGPTVSIRCKISCVRPKTGMWSNSPSSSGVHELREAIAAEFPNLQWQAVSDGAIRVESSEPVRVGPLVRFFEDHGLKVAEARKIHPSLEDVFVQVTGIGVAVMKQELE